LARRIKKKKMNTENILEIIHTELTRAIEIWQDFLVAYSDSVIEYGVSF
jgi:hypothetical protein